MENLLESHFSIPKRGSEKFINYHKMRWLIKQTLKEFGFKTHKVAVDIYGRTVYLTEPEVRALQIIAKRKAEESPEVFQEFITNVTIYKGRYKGHKDLTDRTMIFRTDGKFYNKFDPGFYDVNANLAFELF